MGLPNPSRETKFSGVNGDRKIFIFPVQLTTSRRRQPYAVESCACSMCDHTYIHTYREYKNALYSDT